MSNAKLNDWNESLIRDDFTQRFYIAPDELRHGEVRFTARPMLFADIEDAEEVINNPKYDTKKSAGRMVRAIVEHVKTWSLSDSVTSEQVVMLRRPILIKMYNMISSQWASDPDPEWQELDTGDSADPDIAIMGQAPIERFQEHLGK